MGEFSHNLVFFVGLHAAMQKLNFKIWKNSLKFFGLLFDRGSFWAWSVLNGAANPINLVASFDLCSNQRIELFILVGFFKDLGLNGLTTFWELADYGDV